MIRATWAVSQNVGDALTPWLIKKLSGIDPVYCPADRPGEKYILSGSILNWADKDTYVWGAGLARVTDGVNADAKLRAVRGPLSAAVAIASGCKRPRVEGDPAFVVPSLYSPNAAITGDLGIVPHYVDQERATILFGDMPGVRILNVFDPVETFLDALCSCDAILSSSLHGLAFSMAYGLPVGWIALSHGVLGDGTKFRDVLWPHGINLDEPVDLRCVGPDDAPSLLDLAAMARHRGTRYDAGPLLNEYPLPRQ